MIWDTFMFRLELDLLEARLVQFDEYELDVRHVLIEAEEDFYGRPKPLHFENNLARYAPWRDLIDHIVVTHLPDTEEPWIREHAQRDAARWHLEQMARDDDLVIIADADEIPSLAACEYRGTPAGLLMRTAHSAVDWLYPAPMPGSVVTDMRYLRGRKLSEVRDGRPGYPLIPHGGWHLSWLGGRPGLRDKLRVSCHRELPAEEKLILFSGLGYETGKHYDVQMIPVEVDETWPTWVKERKCPANWFRPR